MRAVHLSLTDYRNYAEAEVALAPGPNLFVGPNGQGKTNLVEALGYLSSLGSHRVSQDSALIRQGHDSAIIRARLAHREREVLVELQLNRSRPNRAQINRAAVRPREVPRYFSSILFAPEDLSLVRGDPAGRRRFLDELLIQRTPRLTGVLSDYERVLKQRNTLLKSARSRGIAGDQLSTLEIWDERLVSLGTEIITERERLCLLLTEPVRSAYEAVAGADHGLELIPRLSIEGRGEDDAEATTSDEPDVPDSERTRLQFREALVRLRRSELDRGVSLAGPHRDDLFLGLNRLPAKGYASHGESWSFALALKLGAADLLRRESASGDPVLILDDVFAELDQSRRRRLADAVRDYEQVLITAAVFEDVPEELVAHTVHIRGGRIIDEPA